MNHLSPIFSLLIPRQQKRESQRRLSLTYASVSGGLLLFFPPSLSAVLRAAAFPLQRQMQFIPMADNIFPRALRRAGGWEAPVDPLPSCSAQACAGVSPCQGEGSKFQNLSDVYCHLYCQSGCRPRKTEEQSPVGSKLRVGGVPRWQSASWRLQGWTREKKTSWSMICHSH